MTNQKPLKLDSTGDPSEFVSGDVVTPSFLPNPSSSTLGGIESLAAVTSNWINTISTSGVPSATQPAFSDISGTAATTQGGTGTGSSQNALVQFGGPNSPTALAAAPAFNSYDSAAIFGGASGLRSLPTTGTITGEYWHNGNWTQTGAITSNGARIHLTGTMTINAAWTVATEISGGRASLGGSSVATAPGGNGGGLGAGMGGNSSTSGALGGSGAGHGGLGGVGGVGITNASVGNGGCTYPLTSLLTGSSGGAGASGLSTIGGAGGAGGGSLYLEVTGAISCTTSCAMTATGGAGTAGASGVGCGGGGSGGGIQMRSFGTITIALGASITAAGGNGPNAVGSTGAAGGGGGGGIIDLSGSTVTNNGTVSASAGTGGTGGAVAAANGGAGIVNLNSFVQNVRSSN
jgi:hypothetical protein